MATTLTANISATAQSFSLAGDAVSASATSAPVYLKVDSEVIAVTGLGGGGEVYGCVRGALGTTPATHTADTTVAVFAVAGIAAGLVIFSGLPTEDPAVEGALWVDAEGVLNVSAGA